MKLRVDLDLTDDEVELLIREAIVLGFRRVEPRERWLNSERKEAVRWLVEQFVRKGWQERRRP